MKPIRSTPAQHAILGTIACFSLMFSLPSAAQPATGSPVPAPQTIEQANAQRLQATQMRDSAEKNHVAEQAACYKKFLVNSCLDDAKKRHTQALIDARKIDNPARDFQREAKRAEVNAKDAERAAKEPVRAAEQKEKASDYRAEEAAKATDRERKKTAKAQQAAEGRQKRAAEEAKRQEKQEKRAKKDAERAAREPHEEEKAAAKAAAGVPKP